MLIKIYLGRKYINTKHMQICFSFHFFFLDNVV